MAGTDLIDLLAADHQTLLEAEDSSLVMLLSQHLSIERDLLYQGITEYCIDSEQTLRRLRNSDASLEACMSEYESEQTQQSRVALDQALHTHIDTLDLLFPELRKCIPGWWLTQSVDMVPMIIGGSPTHGHRILSESGPIGEVAEDIAAIADHIRKRVHKTE